MPIHPVIASRLHLLAGIDSFEQLMSDPALAERFARFTGAAQPHPPSVSARAADLPGPHGSIPVRIYDSIGFAADAVRPVLIWLHGGAFVFGDLDMAEADAVAREIVLRADAVVVTVDYRLAIDGIAYPVPHDDVVAAVRWVRDHAAELGADPRRISLGGASAGANLAAGASIKLRDVDKWQPAALVLAYPVMHPLLPVASPELETAMTAVPSILRFPAAQVQSITENYLGGPADIADAYAMPALAPLSGLGFTVVLNSEYDDLRASGEAFAASLASAGVDVVQVMARGMLHGFLNMSTDLEPVEAAIQLIAKTVGSVRVPA